MNHTIAAVGVPVRSLTSCNDEGIEYAPPPDGRRHGVAHRPRKRPHPMLREMGAAEMGGMRGCAGRAPAV